jgi:hypothetical protein
MEASHGMQWHELSECASALQFKTEFQALVTGIQSAQTVVEKAARDVTMSLALKSVCVHILALGNAMNAKKASGTVAYGLSLATLTKAKDVKATDGTQQSLLDFIVGLHAPARLSVSQDLALLSLAVRVERSVLHSELQYLGTSLKVIARVLSRMTKRVDGKGERSPAIDEWGAFHAEVQHKHHELGTAQSRVRASVDQLGALFGTDDGWECFHVLHTLCEQWDDSAAKTQLKVTSP